jgi:hypothetical protein
MSAGWLKQTNFSAADEDPIKATICLEIAQKHASLFIYHNIKEYSQWFPGKENIIADALSWDFDLSNLELTKTLCLHCPSQLPHHLQVVQLPREIESWLTSLLLQLPVKEQLQEQQSKTKLGLTGIEYLELIGLAHNPFLNRFNRCQQNLLICAFATAIKEGWFSSNAFKNLAAGPVGNTISSICFTFREHERPNPSKDKDLQSCFLLQQQYKSYVNDDPKQKQQKAIPICVIAKIAKRKNTE